MEKKVNHNKILYIEENTLASIIRAIAIIIGLIGILVGINMLESSENMGIVTIISSLAVGSVLFAEAEKIDLLNNIKENTEHFRENVNMQKENKKVKEI